MPEANARIYAHRFSQLYAVVKLRSFEKPVPPPPTPDTTAPLVALVSPSEGPLSIDTPIVINVTDAVGLGMVLLEVDFAPFGSKAPERIAVGDGFSPPYAASSRVAIAGGYQYTVRRAGGWPAAPRFNVWATDRAGNEV